MRYLLAIALVFSFLGIASADNVPIVTDPKNAATVWTQEVYNGSGSDITSAIAVRWDIDTSANDMSMWIAKNDTTIADIRTAGVVPYGYPIANTTTGVIIVKGPAIMYDNGNTTTVNTGVEADASGWPVDETLAAPDEALLGWVIKAQAETAANTALTGLQYCVIFVHPTPYSGD